MKGKWSTDWVEARVAGCHHQALTAYLLKRTELQAKEADEEGLTVPEIMRRAFKAENGQQTVPKCAIKLVRNGIPGIDMSFVIKLCRASFMARGHIVELAKVLEKKPVLSEEEQTLVNEATVREVLDS